MFEFGQIVCIDDGFEIFEDNWEPWKHAIIKYSQESQSKPKVIQKALQELVPGDSGNTIVCVCISCCDCVCDTPLG